EQAVAVDHGTGRELSGHEQRDRRRRPDARRGDRDREDDERSEHGAEPEPLRRRPGVADPAEPTPEREEDGDRDHGREAERPRDRLERPDALAEASHHGRLNRPRQPRCEGQRRRHCRSAAHSHDAIRSGTAETRKPTRPGTTGAAEMAEPAHPSPVDPSELDFEKIVYEKAPPRATIRLNRPEVLNAFDFRMLREIARACEDASWDDDIRVVVVTGSGRAFCVGADLRSWEEDLLGNSSEYWKWFGAFKDMHDRQIGRAHV